MCNIRQVAVEKAFSGINDFTSNVSLLIMQEISFKIQFLRLLQSFSDHHEWVTLGSRWLWRVYFTAAQGLTWCFSHTLEEAPRSGCSDGCASLVSAVMFSPLLCAGTNTSCSTARSWTNWVPYPWRPTSPRWKLWSTPTGAWCVTGRRACWRGSSPSWRGSLQTRPSGQGRERATGSVDCGGLGSLYVPVNDSIPFRFRGNWINSSRKHATYCRIQRWVLTQILESLAIMFCQRAIWFLMLVAFP